MSAVSRGPRADSLGRIADRWRPRLLEYLDDHQNDVVNTTSRLIRIPSVSGSAEENEIQGQLADELTQLGLEVDHWPIALDVVSRAPGFPGTEAERHEAWGLVARRPGRDAPTAQTLMLNAHVDVVPPGDERSWRGAHPFDGRIENGAIHGRGSCDMKGGLAAALWVVRALTELNVPLRGDLLLACVQGEEDGGLGTFAALDRGVRADGCVIAEPTSLDLVPAAAGALTFRLRVDGLAAHASRRLRGISAIDKFGLALRALRNLEGRRNRAVDPLMQGWDLAYPLEIGRMTAGNWPSSVPDVLIAEGRYGVALDESVPDARAEFAGALEKLCASDAWLRDHPITVEWWGGEFAPGRTDPDAPIVHAVRAAHRAVSDRPQGEWGAPFGSDLRLLTGLAGVPTVHYGPGDVGLAHGPQEMVPVADVLTTARALAVLALDYCLADTPSAS